MTAELITPSNIIFALGIISMIFGVYSYFRNPQIASDKESIKTDSRLDVIEKTLTNLKDNHIHSLDLKIDETNKKVSGIEIQMTKIATIVEERLPNRANKI